MARPSSYTRAVGDAICLRLIDGESVRGICRDASMPHVATVMRWLAGEATQFVAFRERYARAREAQADKEFDEIRELADGAHAGALAEAALIMQAWGGGDSSIARANARTRYYEELQARKMQIDARKFRVARMAPRKYGERVSMEIATDPARPIRIEHALDDDGLARALSMLDEAGALPSTNGESESPDSPREDRSDSGLSGTAH